MTLAAVSGAAPGATPDEDSMPDGALPVDEVGSGDRASLTSIELAFLEGSPTYEVTEAPFVDEEDAPVLAWAPSPERRAAALRLFCIIGGSAVLVLVLALLRLLLGGRQG